MADFDTIVIGAGADIDDSTLRWIDTDDPRRDDALGAIEAVVRPALELVREAAEHGDARGASGLRGDPGADSRARRRHQ